MAGQRHSDIETAETLALMLRQGGDTGLADKVGLPPTCPPRCLQHYHSYFARKGDWYRYLVPNHAGEMLLDRVATPMRSEILLIIEQLYLPQVAACLVDGEPPSFVPLPSTTP